jgi:hypothetical protein
MAGGLPGAAGIAVFVGVKFGGYFLAGKVLNTYVAAIRSPAWKIAAVRTILGVILGPPMTLSWMWLVGLAEWPGSRLRSGYVLYAGLAVIRVFVWAFVLFVFSERKEYPASRLWFHAVLCAAWSCLLEWPGYKLADITPGKITVC